MTDDVEIPFSIYGRRWKTQGGWTISYWSLLIATGPLHPLKMGQQIIQRTDEIRYRKSHSWNAWQNPSGYVNINTNNANKLRQTNRLQSIKHNYRGNNTSSENKLLGHILLIRICYIKKKWNGKTNKFIKTLFSPVIKTNNFSKQQGESPNFYKNKFRQLLSFVWVFFTGWSHANWYNPSCETRTI